METVKAAVMAVCAISAARCVIGHIISASRLKDQVMFLLNLLLAAVMLAPFVQGFSMFSMPDISDYEFADYDYGDDPYAEELVRRTEENITAVLGQQLSAAGINYTELVTDVNISADYSISISSVTVATEDFEAAALILKSCLGDETGVINGNV